MKTSINYFTYLIICPILLSASLCNADNSAIPIHQSLHDLQTQKNLDHVLLLMQKRLALMHEVARTKWNQNLPIEDLPREKLILSHLAKEAESYDLEEIWVRKFFQAQFDAAKMIQKKDFAIWTQQQKPKFDSILDLKQEIRPYLDEVTNELLKALTRIYAEVQNGGLTVYMLSIPLSKRISDVIDEKIWQTAIQPLTLDCGAQDSD